MLFVKRKIILKLIALCFASVIIKEIECISITPEIAKYCREKERLITTDELDEYLVIDAELGETVILECRFCNEEYSEKDQPKIWHWQDRNQSMKLQEVEPDMDNNATLQRISMSIDFSLTIRFVTLDDAGIYRCFGKNGLEEENKYNYRLEPVFEAETYDSSDKGNLIDWEKYRKNNLEPVTTRFTYSRMKEFIRARDEGIILEVITEWGPWGPCENCVAGRGEKTRKGFCRLLRHFKKDVALNNDTDIVKFFLKSPLLPCRSRFLQEKYPTISAATKPLPDFLLVEMCKHCRKHKKVKKHKFKYKKRYVLLEGGRLTIACPESTVQSLVVWRKDSLLLAKGKGHSFRRKDPEPRVLVDFYYTLYLRDVSENEQGNYTCYVDKIRMMQLKIVVVSKGLLTEAFVRHLGYLTFILLLTLNCYCVGVARACRNRQNFEIQTYEQIAERENLLIGS